MKKIDELDYSKKLDLENDELAKKYYILLLDNLIEREEEKIKKLQEELENL